MPGYKGMRDKGVMSPSEVDRLKRARENIVRNTQKAMRDNYTKGAALGAMRDKGVMSPSEIASRGYKYFPDNP